MYTEEELSILGDILRKGYKKGDIGTIIKPLLPRRSLNSICVKLCKLRCREGKGKRYWTKREEEIIRNLPSDKYGDIKKSVFGLLPNRSLQAIYCKKGKLKHSQIDPSSSS